MEQLQKALEQLKLPYEEKTLNTFEKYMELVLEWNNKVNLTTITEHGDFIKKHFIDSIICAGFPEFTKAKKVIDVGTGAGFPGVPLAILAVDKEFLLMDSLGKRIKILDEICHELGLKNVRLLHGRAEEAAQEKEYRNGYDLCVSRAVANLSTLSEYCLPFVRTGGYFLAYKGPDHIKETQEAERAIKLLGGTLKETRSVELPDFDLNHIILCIEKTRLTPAKYPRKAGMPGKEPLK